MPIEDAAGEVPPASIPSALTPKGRYLILVVAFLGWLCAGLHNQITQQVARPAAIDLMTQSGELDGLRYRELSKQAKANKDAAPLSSADSETLKQGNTLVGRWFAWIQCAFLFGAAAGGLWFGWLGDRIGRSKAMASSILTYSVLSGATGLAQTPEQFWGLWFFACAGVGGMWPNGVALVAEVWSGMSRPVVAGVFGVAANVGIFLMATITRAVEITPDDWRWALFVGAAPVVLGLFALVAVPESPRWLAARALPPANVAGAAISESVFRPPLLSVTVIAILLATIPIVGGWGTANWMNPWADEYGAAQSPPDRSLQPRMAQARSFTGMAGSLLGGLITSLVGRRLTYFLVSLASLSLAQFIFWRLVPTDPWFMISVSALGFVSGIYFGWLPLCLPELFPTRVRSTGAGVGFNFGRILTGVMLFAAGTVMHLFGGDYPHTSAASRACCSSWACWASGLCRTRKR